MLTGPAATGRADCEAGVTSPEPAVVEVGLWRGGFTEPLEGCRSRLWRGRCLQPSVQLERNRHRRPSDQRKTEGLATRCAGFRVWTSRVLAVPKKKNNSGIHVVDCKP